MKVRYASLREPVVLPIKEWFKGQAHSYSTFIIGDVNLPGLDLERNAEEVTVLCNGVPVAGIPLANLRGFVYNNDETPAEEVLPAEIVSEQVTENHRRRRS